MADKKGKSVEDILAACRKADGGGNAAGQGPSSDKPVADTPTEAGGAAKTPSKEAAATGKKPSEMSVEEILASARQAVQGPESGKSGEAAKKPAAAGEKPSNMSVADVLAAARGPKVGDVKTKPAAKKPDQPAPKAKPTVKAESSGPMDTSSILAAARAAAKPGPISKAEAAAQVKAVPTDEPRRAAKAKREVAPLPEKPAYAKATATEPPGEPRRTFVAAMVGAFCGSFLAIGWTAVGLTNLLWGLATARFMFPNILTEPPTRFKVGFPGDFSPGAVQTKFKAQYGAWIVNHVYEGQPQIFAIRTVCTHLGCTPNWLEAEQKFKCPCHGSGFYKEGINFEGPAPRPLERYAIRIADDGQLEVDKSRIFQEEKGQWHDSASFVPV